LRHGDYTDVVFDKDRRTERLGYFLHQPEDALASLQNLIFSTIPSLKTRRFTVPTVTLIHPEVLLNEPNCYRRALVSSGDGQSRRLPSTAF
jgi:hypothetical protein